MPTPEALASDGWEEYARLRKDHALDSSRVHLVGFSLGTSVVAAIVARADREAPASITLLAPMSVLEMLPENGFRPDRYETLKYLDFIKSPTLVVHGGRDETLPTQNGRLVATRLAPRARYVELSQLGHLDLLMSVETLDTVRSFIDETVQRVNADASSALQ
jgi:pimeloyl-ACP methyl ester carboxylesterase